MKQDTILPTHGLMPSNPPARRPAGRVLLIAFLTSILVLSFLKGETILSAVSPPLEFS